MNRREALKILGLAGMGILGGKELAFAEKLISSAPNNYHKVPLLPWGYVKLDEMEAFKRGYLGYFVGECSAGVFWAITSLLREKLGGPYAYLPIPSLEEMIRLAKAHKKINLPMKYGNGGIEGYGTVCGALNGAASAINYAFGHKEARAIIRRLFRWYETTAFPTELANKFAKEHKFYNKGKTDKELPSICSHSVLCHIVVSEWCKETGYASGSKERSERCARITASVARHAVLLMNAALEGKLEEKYPFVLDSTTQTCRSCHHKGKNFKRGEFARGYMECMKCHGEKELYINLPEHLKEVVKEMK